MGGGAFQDQDQEVKKKKKKQIYYNKSVSSEVIRDTGMQ